MKRLPATSMLRASTGERETRSVVGEQLWWPKRSSAGVAVTPHSALGLAAYYSSVNVLSTDSSILPFRCFRRMPDGGSELQAGHDVDELLHVAPNTETIPISYRQSKMGHALQWGNGYSEIQRKGKGTPYAIHLLDPSITKAYRENGELFYRNGSNKIPAANILHLSGFGFDGLSGYNPIHLLETTIGLGLAVDRNACSFFGNGTRHGGYIKHSGTLSDLALKHLKETLQDEHGGPDNAYRLAILEEGMDWIQSTTDPQIAQSLESRQFTYTQIAGIFRLPPHKIGDFSQAHLANIEASNLDYFTTGLLPWLLKWEQECNKKLFTRKERAAGFYCEHSMLALLRGDSSARSKFYQSMINMGVFVPNDIARLENLNPIGPAGNVRLVPSNMAQILPDGTIIPAATGTGPKATANDPKATTLNAEA